MIQLDEDNIGHWAMNFRNKEAAEKRLEKTIKKIAGWGYAIIEKKITYNREINYHVAYFSFTNTPKKLNNKGA